MSQQAAPRLVAALFGTFKLTQMYGRDHDAVEDALASLASAMEETIGDASEVVISLRGSRVLVNESPMRSSECGSLALDYLATELETRGVEHIHFPKGVSAEDLDGFVQAFLEIDPAGESPAQSLIAAVAARSTSNILVEPLDERREEPAAIPEREKRRESAMRAYLRGLHAFKEVLGYEGLEDRTKIRQARRAVQGLVDRFVEDEAAMLALAQIRTHDEKLFHHSLKVCIYSLAIGQRMGMARRQLGELGMAALFHDIGKTASEATGLAETREHTVQGARLLLRTRTAHEGILKAAIAAYEHHARLDRQGVPDIEYEPHLVSRIVTIADCYESLTSARGDEEPCSSHEALRLMHARAGTMFDPLLLKVFVNAMGVYPVGSVVELSTGEVGLVVSGPAQGNEADRPTVRLLRNADGTPAEERDVDLAAPGADEPERTILRPLPAHEVFDSVSDFVQAI